MDSFTHINELRELYEHGRLVPFVGAGVSMSVHWKDSDGTERRGPSWIEFVDQAIQLLGVQDPELLRVRGTDLQILEYFKLKKGGHAQITNWLYMHMNAPDEVLRDSKIHTALAQLDQCKTIYTTNYDDFIERSLKLHGKASSVIVTEQQMGKALSEVDPGKHEVVKFHGDLNHPDQMVISESHYERRLRLGTPLDWKLRADVLGRAILFIGYSFRDWNVSYLFRLVNDEFHALPDSPSGRRAYITVPSPSDFEIQLFRSRNIAVIPIHDKDQTNSTADLLTQIAAS